MAHRLSRVSPSPHDSTIVPSSPPYLPQSEIPASLHHNTPRTDQNDAPPHLSPKNSPMPHQNAPLLRAECLLSPPASSRTGCRQPTEECRSLHIFSCSPRLSLLYTQNGEAMSSTASPSLYCFLYRFLSGKCWKYLQYLISLRCQADADLPHIVRVKHHNRLARITIEGEIQVIHIDIALFQGN